MPLFVEGVYNHILLPLHMLYLHVVLTKKIHPTSLTSVEIGLREEVAKTQVINLECKPPTKKKMSPQ